jgi:hypothetical protein
MILQSESGQVRREERQRHAEDGTESHLDELEAVAVSMLPELGICAVAAGEFRRRFGVVATDHY